MPEARQTLYELLMSIKPDDLAENAWVKRAGLNRNFFQDVKHGARPRSDNIEKLVEAIGWTPAQFYDLEETRKGRRVEPGPKRGLPFQRRDEARDVPLLGTAQGSDLEVDEGGKIIVIDRMDLDVENVVDFIRRPSALAGRQLVYAITVIGNSMADRYVDGDPAYVDPGRQAKPGDYVVIQLIKRDDYGEGRITGALLKRLVRKTSTIVELEQANPPVRFSLPRSEIEHIHRVTPWSEIVFF